MSVFCLYVVYRSRVFHCFQCLVSFNRDIVNIRSFKLLECNINKKDWNYSSIRDQVLLVEEIPNNQLWLSVETLLKMGIVWVWAPCQDASGKWRWIQSWFVAGQEQRSRRSKGPRCQKTKWSLNFGGLWSCLKFLTGHHPRLFAAAPTVHLLLPMAQEHPIFGQQFFLRWKNTVNKECLRWKANDGKYFADRNLWRMHVAISWTCCKNSELANFSSPHNQFQIRDVAAAEPWAGFAAFKTAGRPLLGCVAGGSHERVLKLRFCQRIDVLLRSLLGPLL